jgi:hypothetical protein
MGGHPAAGNRNPDEAPDDIDDPGEGDEGDEGEDNTPAPKGKSELEELRTRVERAESEVATLRRATPPAAPKAPAGPDPDEEWMNSKQFEEDLFKSPAETLKRRDAIMAKRIKKDLQTEYQRDQGTVRFWDNFYGKYPELKADRDLVEVTLNSHLADLANIPVDSAYEKLAELTRDRILRYAGGKSRKPKARAEGADPPKPKVAEEEKPQSVSLGSVIRNMRASKTAAA